MNRTLRTLLSGFIIAILALVAVPTADAASIRLTSGGDQVIIHDEGVGDFAPGAPGVVAFFGSVGVFEFTGTLGVTKPATPSDPPFMELHLNTTSTDAGVLEVEFSETGFGPSGTVAFAGGDGSAGNTPGSGLVYDTFQDPGNILFGEAHLITTDATLTGGPYSFAQFGALSTGTAPYSLMQQLTVTHSSPGTTTFDGVLIVLPQAVPDGGWAIGLLGFGLIGVERLRRRFTRL